jgi:uncharacterized protein YjiS (DUF1127 family)
MPSTKIRHLEYLITLQRSFIKYGRGRAELEQIFEELQNELQDR